MKKTIVILIIFSSLVAKAQISIQEQPNWCWASCIQSVLWQANVVQNQPQIVARLNGWIQDRPANGFEITNLLLSYGLKAWQTTFPANYTDLYSTLNAGWKIIAFVNPTNNQMIGHFIILQGISQNGFVIISDPSSGQTYEQDIQQLYYNWKWTSSVIVGRKI